MTTLYDLTQTAISDLRDWAADNPNCDEPHDTIHEIADSSVPVYTYDLLQLAGDNLNLAVDTPDLGPAFDGSPTPVNIIAANVYEYITAALWENWNEIESEREELEVE